MNFRLKSNFRAENQEYEKLSEFTLVWVECKSAFKGRLWHSRKNHKHSQNIFHRVIFEKAFVTLLLSATLAKRFLDRAILTSQNGFLSIL